MPVQRQKNFINCKRFAVRSFLQVTWICLESFFASAVSSFHAPKPALFQLFVVRFWVRSVEKTTKFLSNFEVC